MERAAAGWPPDERPAGPLYLQTSPEFFLKRLVAAGVPAVYAISHAFRAGEHGSIHHVEFPMLEWYRVGDDLAEGVELLADLTTAILGEPGPTVTRYAAAFARHAGIDPLTAEADELADAAERLGLTVPASATGDAAELRNVILAEHVAPRLGVGRPEIVTHYPADEAALARLDPTDLRVAERFELFVAGVELANGYHELTDADELVRRSAAADAARVVVGKPSLPIPTHLTAALRAGLPPCSGCALGLDRLLMVRTGQRTLAAVTPFPTGRA